MPEKCDSCVLRYHCDEMTEWTCKNNNSLYDPDISKISELEEKLYEEWRPV